MIMKQPASGRPVPAGPAAVAARIYHEYPGTEPGKSSPGGSGSALARSGGLIAQAAVVTLLSACPSRAYQKPV